LDTHQTDITNDPLLAWCRAVLNRHAESWPPSENVLAEAFVTTFGADACHNLENLRELCAHLGIEVTQRPMPADIRGHNSFYQAKRSIVLSSHQPLPGTDEHTLLHELREVIEHIFKELGFGTCSEIADLEMRAEMFAGYVRSEAFSRTLPVYFEHAQQIEVKWVRYGAYAILGIGALAYMFTCLFLPFIEDTVVKDLNERNVRT
jgi:hypothetical protein